MTSRICGECGQLTAFYDTCSCVRQQLANAEARVRELEEEQHEDRDAIRYIWLKTPGYIAHVWYPTHGRAINRAVGHSERNAVIDAARRTP